MIAVGIRTLVTDPQVTVTYFRGTKMGGDWIGFMLIVNYHVSLCGYAS